MCVLVCVRGCVRACVLQMYACVCPCVFCVFAFEMAEVECELTSGFRVQPTRRFSHDIVGELRQQQRNWRNE